MHVPPTTDGAIDTFPNPDLLKKVCAKLVSQAREADPSMPEMTPTRKQNH